MQIRNRRELALIRRAMLNLADPGHPDAERIACHFFGASAPSRSAPADLLGQLFADTGDLTNAAPRALFDRWVSVTQRLAKLGIHDGVWPWTMLGVLLCQRVERQLPRVWQDVLTLTADLRMRTGVGHPDLLSHDPTALPMSEIVPIEREVLKALLAQGRRSTERGSEICVLDRRLAEF